MSETYTTGGGRSDYRLPTVSTSDNGKILKVVEGEWEKAEGGSGLPEYGESDAGKVLKVAEGGESIEWAEAGGGGGDTFVIHLTVTVDPQTFEITTITSDKTNAEMREALIAKKAIFAVISTSIDFGIRCIHLSRGSYGIDNNALSLSFVNIDLNPNTGAVQWENYFYDYLNGWSHYTLLFTGLTPVS